jgi:hypothetical protein
MGLEKTEYTLECPILDHHAMFHHSTETVCSSLPFPPSTVEIIIAYEDLMRDNTKRLTEEEGLHNEMDRLVHDG